MLVQYATKLGGFSSQYGATNSISYVASNILKEPTLFPQYGDFTQACVLRTYAHWWKVAPEAPLPLPNLSDRYFVSDDFIEVIFDHKVYIEGVNIYETYYPGSVVRLLALDQSATQSSNKWFVMWEVAGGCPPITERSSRIFSPKIKSPPFPSQIVRLEFRHDHHDYYTELDCIQLIGATEVDVDNIKYGGGSDALTSRMGGLALGGEDKIPVSSSPGNNGSFDKLPGEILSKILSYLPTDDLSRLSLVSTLFHEHCYNPLLSVHVHLNLQPYWYLLDQHSLTGFSRKCTKLRSLNLSWCGNHSDMFTSGSVLQLVQPASLVRLDLACCPLNDHIFKQILRACHNLQALDVSSTLEFISCRSLQLVSTLTELTRLNLYMTAVDGPCMIAIARMCPKLQYVNLGSCPAVRSYNEVVESIAEECLMIKGLDLWRAKSLTSEGILHLAKQSKQLLSLDIGWCGNVIGQDGCLKELVKNCGGLRKLYLTANRSITDEELLALAKHCPELEQLDLLGNNSVSMVGLRPLMESCKRLIMLDISFCPKISDEYRDDLAKLYPKCSVKKSFCQ